VYIWRTNGGSYQTAPTQRIVGEALPDDHFGYAVKLDDGGHKLLITHDRFTAGGNVYNFRGTLDIYRAADNSSPFVFDRRGPRIENGSCEGVALSGNGRTWLRACTDNAGKAVYVSDAGNSFRLPVTAIYGMDISYDQTEIVVQDGLTAKAYRKNGVYWQWLPDGELSSSFPGESTGNKRRIALSRDGKIAVIGNPSNDTPGRGPVFPPYGTDGAPTGAAVVYERKSTGWTVRRLVRPNSTNAEWFGHSVALGDNGRILAVGAPYDPSAAEGINGDPDDNSAFERGSVWLY
jgi:hypothetical protein